VALTNGKRGRTRTRVEPVAPNAARGGLRDAEEGALAMLENR
jgi:hypothetical protein